MVCSRFTLGTKMKETTNIMYLHWELCVFFFGIIVIKMGGHVKRGKREKVKKNIFCYTN